MTFVAHYVLTTGYVFVCVSMALRSHGISCHGSFIKPPKRDGAASYQTTNRFQIIEVLRGESQREATLRGGGMSRAFQRPLLMDGCFTYTLKGAVR